MQFTPRFSRLTLPAEVARESKIVGKDGTVVFQAQVFVPETWSQTATDMIAQKYMRKAGVPDKTVTVPEDGVPGWLQRSVPAEGATFGAETSAKQVFHRLAKAWTYHGWKANYFDDEPSARCFYDELVAMLTLQMAAPNSPQWFNTGLSVCYGITGTDQGQWRIDGDTVVPSREAYVFPGVGACYINHLEDSLVEPRGILDFTTTEARIFKFGSGSGANYSRLRGKGEPLSGGGKSSGLPSFLKPIDRYAGAIKSGGTTRRAARMVVLDLDHPDIEWFVDWKVGEEHKVACLVAGSRVMREALTTVYAAAKGVDARVLRSAEATAAALGIPLGSIAQTVQAAKLGLPVPNIPTFDTHYEGDAYETVSGQNANNSVSVTAAFMEAVAADGDWHLYHRVEKVKAEKEGRAPVPCRTIKAKLLWERIAKAAWACADPGVQFRDTLNDWNTVVNDGEIEASNPCSEFLFLNDTTCNLACLNFVPLVNPADPTETYDNFAHASRLWSYVLDITVGMSGYPGQRVAEGALKYRTFGLGYANVGALLMRLGVAYDSDAGRGWAAGLTALVHFGATKTSAELATRLGGFPRYKANAEHSRRVLRNHVAYVTDQKYEGLTVTPPDPTNWFNAAPQWVVEAAFRSAAEAVKEFDPEAGLRNAQLTLIMPAGTVGLVMDCDTTGVEPDFALIKGKSLAGGGWLKIVNQSVRPALVTLGYPPEEVEAITGYVYETGTVEKCPQLRPEHLSVFDTAVSGGTIGKRSISVDGHLLMMAAVQPLLSGGISKTVNMAADSTVADVRATYTKSWKLMLKCVALYRDQSKLSQPLQSIGTVDAKLATGPLPVRGSRRRLSSIRKGHTAKLKVGGHKMYLTSGEFDDGALGEIFLTWHKEGSSVRFWAGVFAQAVSLGLQYGVPLSEFVEAFTFTDSKPNGVVTDHPHIKSATSVVDLIFRHLGIHYDDRKDLAHVGLDTSKGEKAAAEIPAIAAGKVEPKYEGNPCTSCGQLRLIRQATCAVCTNCGTTTGCA